MSFALLRSGVVRRCAVSLKQPRCSLKLKSQGVDYYWLDYPYEKIHQVPSIFDRPQWRLNDNSRSICVEGNVAVGKGTFAKNLAEALYLKYIPDINDNDMFVDKNFEPTIDYRDYNKVLPKNLQFYTTEMLYTDQDPVHHGKPLYLQQNYYMYRCVNYWKACAHLFHTGQGFVTSRSPFATYAFAKAMAECNLMSADAKDWFLYYDHHVNDMLMCPHLVVYLRAPVTLSRANLAKRAIPWESGVSDKFLEVIKQIYETEFLPKIARFSEIYTVDVEDYNFNDHNDITYLAEQLCKIDLDQKQLSTDIDTKLIHWRQATFNNNAKTSYRARFSNLEPIMKRLFGIQAPDDMPEAGLTIQQAAKVRDEYLSRDPRFHQCSELNPRDSKSKLNVLLGHVRNDGTQENFWYDGDLLKLLAYFRSYGYYKRSVANVYRND